MRKTAISFSSVSVSSPLSSAALIWISARSRLPAAVTAVSVMMRLSRIDNPGRDQMSPNRWSTVRSKYGVALDVGHLPAVDLVHLLQALAAQFVHHVSFCVVRYPEAGGQPLEGQLGQRQVNRDRLAQGQRQAQILLAQPAGVHERAGTESCPAQGLSCLSRTMIAPGPLVSASVWRTTLPSACRSSPAASASFMASPTPRRRR